MGKKNVLFALRTGFKIIKVPMSFLSLKCSILRVISTWDSDPSNYQKKSIFILVHNNFDNMSP